MHNGAVLRLSRVTTANVGRLLFAADKKSVLRSPCGCVCMGLLLVSRWQVVRRYVQVYAQSYHLARVVGIRPMVMIYFVSVIKLLRNVLGVIFL